MTLTKNAIGNLVNRYKAVLKKCNLLNAFGSLAVASMLVLGGAGAAMANEGIYWGTDDPSDPTSWSQTTPDLQPHQAGIADTANASDATVVIDTNTAATIYGGYSNDPTWGEATGNTVILSSATVDGNVYGGAGTTVSITGNTLRVVGKSEVTEEVRSFENYEFVIPSTFKANDTSEVLLTVNDIKFDDAAKAKITSIEGSRNVGDVFNLLHYTGSVDNEDNLLTSATETADASYQYTLSWLTGQQIFQARITDVLLHGKDFGNMLGGELGRMFDEAFASGEVKPSFAENYSKPAGVRFLARAINPRYGNGSTEAAKAVESVAQTTAIAAVAQMTMGASEAGVKAISQRTSIGQPTGALQSTTLNAASGLNSGDDISGMSAGGGYDKSGLALWIMPLWQSNNSFGIESGKFEIDSHGSIGGIAIGADYTIDQAIRLGLTFNIGGGYAEGSGDLSKTTNNMNFWGIGAYASWAYENFGLSADITYTSTHSDIKQEVDASFRMQDMESKVMASIISTGLRAEYKFNTDALDIIPHVGVRYTHLAMYGHDVESAGETVLEANTSRQNIWTFPIGVQFSKSFDMNNGWYVRPSLDLTVTPAAGDIDVKREVRFSGVTASASPETQTMDWITYGGTAGIELGNDNLKLGLNYSLQAGAHTTNHGVFGTLCYEF